MKLKYMKFKSTMMLLIATLFTVNTFAQTAKTTPKRLAKVDGIVRFERLGRDKKKVSVYEVK